MYCGNLFSLQKSNNEKIIIYILVCNTIYSSNSRIFSIENLFSFLSLQKCYFYVFMNKSFTWVVYFFFT